MDVDRTVHTRRTGGWSAAIVPIGVALMLLGAWAFVAPLVGPYFEYGFDTDTTWLFSTRQWELSLGPGIVIFLGGLLMLVPAARLGRLAGLLATAGGMWLLVGPSVYPLWASDISPDGSSEMQTLQWIGYFYGTGALTVFFAAYAEGLLTRRTYVEERAPVVASDPVTEHRRAA